MEAGKKRWVDGSGEKQLGQNSNKMGPKNEEKEYA